MSLIVTLFIVPVFALLLHLFLMLLCAPTLAGISDWVEARLAGRSGPPLLLPWRDLMRLSRKTKLVSENASIALRVGPAVSLGAILVVVALVPSFTLGMALAPESDVLVVATLLTVSRVAGVLAALDTGAALPGVAAERNGRLAILAEPALLLSLFTLALMAGSLGLEAIISQQREGILLPATASAVTLTAFLALLLAENFSAADPLARTLNGPDLAMWRATQWLRRLVWINLTGALFLPIGLSPASGTLLDWLIGLGCWVVKLAGCTLALCSAQTLLGRIASRGLPDLLGMALLLGLLATVMVLAGSGAV